MGDPNWFKTPRPPEEPKQTKRQRLAEWARAEKEKLNQNIIRLHEQRGSATDAGGLTPQEEERQARAFQKMKAEWDAFMQKDLPPAIEQKELPPYTEEELNLIKQYELESAAQPIPGEEEARERVETMPQHPLAGLVNKQGAFKGLGGVPAPESDVLPVEPAKTPEAVVPKAVVSKKKPKAEPVPIELTVPKSLKTEVDEPEPTALNVVDGKVEHFGDWVPLTKKVFDEKVEMMQESFNSLNEQLESEPNPAQKALIKRQMDNLSQIHDQLIAALPTEDMPAWEGPANKLLSLDGAGLMDIMEAAKISPDDPDVNSKLAQWLKAKNYDAVSISGDAPIALDQWIKKK